MSNVDNYPSIVRSNWNYEKKLLYILKEFIYFENLIIKKKPKLILSLTPSYIINLLSKYKSIKYYSLAYAKLGERFLWGDNCYPDNKFLITKKIFSIVVWTFLQSCQPKKIHSLSMAGKPKIYLLTN